MGPAVGTVDGGDKLPNGRNCQIGGRFLPIKNLSVNVYPRLVFTLTRARHIECEVKSRWSCVHGRNSRSIGLDRIPKSPNKEKVG